MTKTLALESCSHACSRRRQPSTQPAHPQSLLDLPPGEARESLLAVHGILEARLPRGRLAIYEAGGGSTSFLPLDVLRRAHVTVVDIDEDQIRNNDYAQETILGDIQTYRFAARQLRSRDLLQRDRASFPTSKRRCSASAKSLKPSGLILIGAPNPRSLSGVVTKYSPHWFHVWFYRHVRGDENAGLPGCRRSRPSSIRWSRFRSSKPSRQARPAGDLSQGI